MTIISFKANSLCSLDCIEVLMRFVLFGVFWWFLFVGFFFPRKGFYSKNMKFLKNSNESLLSLASTFGQKYWVTEDLENPKQFVLTSLNKDI